MRRSIGMLAATTLLVAGCSAGQGNPKVALTVGGVQVSTVDQVQQKLNDLLATNKAAQEQAKQRKLGEISRGIVAEQALHQITGQAMQRLGITIPEELVEQAIPTLTGPQATQGDPFQSIVDAAFPAKDIARNRLALIELGGRSVGRTAVTFDAAFPQNLEDARKLAAKVAANPAESGKLMQEAPNPAQEAIIGQTQDPSKARDPQQLMQAAASPLFTLPAGSVVATRLGGEQGGYVVFYLKSKQSAQPPQDFDPTSVEPLQLAQVGRAQLVSVAQQAGVQLNPRFGTWDPVTLKALSGEEASTVSSLLQVKTPKP
nr:PpiC-type peptidyl-prolyl cis-trans isomerase precursor [Kibdelosporangium sp. MJ126-NF4]